MPLFVVVRGRFGSGKTELARRLETDMGFRRVDYDAAMLARFTIYPMAVRTEAVRDRARSEGRTSVGSDVRKILDGGTSVVCDADIRDAIDLRTMIDAAGVNPTDPKLCVIRLDVSHRVGLGRKVNESWGEFRTFGRGSAIQYYERAWGYPFRPIFAEAVIDTDLKTAEEVFDEVKGMLAERTNPQTPSVS
jgi:hypothetical protein